MEPTPCTDSRPEPTGASPCVCADPTPVCARCGGDVATPATATPRTRLWPHLDLTTAEARALLEQARALTTRDPVVEAARHARQIQVDEAWERLRPRR